MAEQQNRGGQIGPSISYRRKDDMAKLADKTEWVETGDGVRRLVVEGAPIPPGLELEEHAQDEEVDPRTLTRPTIDEEAAKSHYERTGAEPPEPNAGISTENVEKAVEGRTRENQRGAGRRQQRTRQDSDSEN